MAGASRERRTGCLERPLLVRGDTAPSSLDLDLISCPGREGRRHARQTHRSKPQYGKRKPASGGVWSRPAGQDPQPQPWRSQPRAHPHRRIHHFTDDPPLQYCISRGEQRTQSESLLTVLTHGIMLKTMAVVHPALPRSCYIHSLAECTLRNTGKQQAGVQEAYYFPMKGYNDTDLSNFPARLVAKPDLSVRYALRQGCRA